jgi:hypothetical protein
MGVLVRVFIPETGIKTKLIHNDIQQIREWTNKHSSKDSTIKLYSRKSFNNEVIFLKEALNIFGVWKNIIIN